MAFVAKFELTERIACKASIMIEGLDWQWQIRIGSDACVCFGRRF